MGECRHCDRAKPGQNHSRSNKANFGSIRDSDAPTGLTESEESQTVLLFVCGDHFLNGSIKPYTDSETERLSVFLHSAEMRVLDVGQVRANGPV